MRLMQNNVALVAFVVAGAFILGAVVMMGVGSFAMAPAAIPILFSILIIGVLIGALVLITRRAAAERGPTPADLAGDLGLRYREAVDGPFHHRFGPLPGVGRTGAISRLFDGRHRGRMVWAFQHTSMIHTGQFSVPVVRSVVAVEAPDWPTLTVRPRSASRRFLGSLRGDPGILLDNEVFNARFHVDCDDHDFAILLLAPQAQELLLETPKVVWRVNPGTVAMIRPSGTAARRIGADLDRLVRFMDMIPPELEVY